MKYMKWRAVQLSIRKLIKYDIKSGTKSNIYKFCFLIGILVCIGLTAMKNLGVAEKSTGKSATILDYICYFTGGPKYIPKDMYQLYVIPVLWLVIYVMISYIVGYYAMTDLDTYGSQILIRSGSRIKWWISKCIWNMVTVVSAFFLIYISAIVAGFLGGANKSMHLTKEIVMISCNIDNPNGSNTTYIIILLIMPIVVAFAISMMQMTIALITSPIIGFIVTQSIVFLSTIFANKVLFVNYSMLSHSNVTCPSNIKWIEGVIISVIIYVISMIMGLIYFSKCNILPKNREE